MLEKKIEQLNTRPRVWQKQAVIIDHGTARNQQSLIEQ